MTFKADLSSFIKNAPIIQYALTGMLVGSLASYQVTKITTPPPYRRFESCKNEENRVKHHKLAARLIFKIHKIVISTIAMASAYSWYNNKKISKDFEWMVLIALAACSITFFINTIAIRGILNLIMTDKLREAIKKDGPLIEEKQDERNDHMRITQLPLHDQIIEFSKKFHFPIPEVTIDSPEEQLDFICLTIALNRHSAVNKYNPYRYNTVNRSNENRQFWQFIDLYRMDNESNDETKKSTQEKIRNIMDIPYYDKLKNNVEPMKRLIEKDYTLLRYVTWPEKNDKNYNNFIYAYDELVKFQKGLNIEMKLPHLHPQYISHLSND